MLDVVMLSVVMLRVVGPMEGYKKHHINDTQHNNTAIMLDIVKLSIRL